MKSKKIEHSANLKIINEMDAMKAGLNENYWDCECKINYINHKKVSHCNICGAYRDDQPDSRVNEVNKHFGN